MPVEGPEGSGMHSPTNTKDKASKRRKGSQLSGLDGFVSAGASLRPDAFDFGGTRISRIRFLCFVVCTLTAIILLAFAFFYDAWEVLVLLPMLIPIVAWFLLIIFPNKLWRSYSPTPFNRDVVLSATISPTHEVTVQVVTVTIPVTTSFPSHVAVGQTGSLQIKVKIPIELETAFRIGKVKPFEIDVLVTAYPSDFVIEGSALQPVELSGYSGPEPHLTFRLIPKTDGKKAFFVEFFQEQHLIARSEIQTTVTKQPNSSSPVTTDLFLTLRLSPSPIDLAILVDFVPLGSGKSCYRYRLISHIEGLKYSLQEFWSPETRVTPQGFLEETFNNLEQMRLGTVTEEVFFERLSSIGTTLYDRLFPDDFKRLYWSKLRNGAIKSLIIYSDEPWVPWELVRPFDPDTKLLEDGFLCEKFNMSRWLRGRIAPEVIPSYSVGLIVTDSNLNFAPLESIEIKKSFEANGIKAEYIKPSSEAIYRLLKTGGFSILHFICHGEHNPNNPDWSTIFLGENTTLTPLDISGNKLAFGKEEAPLVFLNACETGRSEYTLTGMGGWAEAFIIRAGCSGFVGAIWSANDETAYNFAKAFYQNLLEGKTIAEAVRLARLSTKKGGDPTWLSYTLYANPVSRLATSLEEQKENDS